MSRPHNHAKALIKCCSLIITAALCTVIAPSAQAQDQITEQFELSTSLESDRALQDMSNGRDLEANVIADDWLPTENALEQVRNGQFRSEKEEVPGGFTKEDADLAQRMEASLELTQNGTIGSDRSINSNTSFASNCQVYWPSPHPVCGAIRDLYNRLGGPASFLGWPRSNELTTPDGVGRRTEFLNGHIYWHPKYGAHSVSTHLFLPWSVNGWEAGPLGYPTSEERAGRGQTSRIQDYSNGTIALSLSGFGATQGLIRQKWIELGADGGWIGLPIGYEYDGVRSGTKCSLFSKADICWSPGTGAHPISGAILDQWNAAGRDGGYLGLPTSDPYNVGNRVEQSFEGGTLSAIGAAGSDAYLQIPLINFPNEDTAQAFFGAVELILLPSMLSANGERTLRTTRASNASQEKALKWGYEHKFFKSGCFLSVDNPHIKASVQSRSYLNFKPVVSCDDQVEKVEFSEGRIKQDIGFPTFKDHHYKTTYLDKGDNPHAFEEPMVAELQKRRREEGSSTQRKQSAHFATQAREIIPTSARSPLQALGVVGLVASAVQNWKVTLRS